VIGNRPKSLGSDPRVPLWLLLVLVLIGIIVVFFVWDIGGVILLLGYLSRDGLM